MQPAVARLSGQAQLRPRRILFPESQDARVIEAAQRLMAGGLAKPLFETRVAESGIPALRDNGSWDAHDAEIRAEIAARMHGKAASAIEQAQDDPLIRAAAALGLGLVDGVVSGSVATTADVLRAGLRGLGLADNTALVSSLFLMQWQGRAMSFADCAVVPAPTPEQLGQIAVATAHSHTRLTGEPAKIAMLSFSTLGSARHPAVDAVRAAVAQARIVDPSLAIDGDLQFDAALLPDIAARKAPDSDVAGQANVFIFPDLNAGNLGYKIAERMGGATATGPILQGFAKPWMDLSRGCSAQDIVNTAVIASALV